MTTQRKAPTGKAQKTTKPKPQKVTRPIEKKAGRPSLPSDSAKASLTLKLRNIVWMDRLCSDIREQTGNVLDRGELLRGMISAVQDSEIDLRNCKTEQDIADAITKKLKS